MNDSHNPNNKPLLSFAVQSLHPPWTGVPTRAKLEMTEWAISMFHEWDPWLRQPSLHVPSLHQTQVWQLKRNWVSLCSFGADLLGPWALKVATRSYKILQNLTSTSISWKILLVAASNYQWVMWVMWLYLALHGSAWLCLALGCRTKTWHLQQRCLPHKSAKKH